MQEIILPEVVAVGHYNAQLVMKNRDLSPHRKVTMFELELPTARGGVSYMDAESVPITPDMFICAKPGQVRHTRLPFQCYFIHMIVREGALCERLMEMPSYIQLDDRAPYEALFKQLCAYYDTGLDDDRLLLQSKLLELIRLLCDHAQRRRLVTKAGNRESIERVIAYIKSNLTADLSLGAVAEYASFSPVYFHNFFKRATGKTLREFVEEQRIQKAVNLLVSTDLTLAKIAYECGFSSQSYFSYAFKQKMRMTPREYVKAICRRYEGEDSLR